MISLRTVEDEEEWLCWAWEVARQSTAVIAASKNLYSIGII
jgi:hypothetical protein